MTITISDPIVDLGYCAAFCELEAHMSPWDRTELEQRAEAYRHEQLRLLTELSPPVDWESLAADGRLSRFAECIAGNQKPRARDRRTPSSAESKAANCGVGAGQSRKI